MKTLPEKKIIFIDTCIFESQNFFKGHKLLNLCNYSRNELVEIKITDIIYGEIVQRINANVNKAKTLYKKSLSTLSGEGKILKISDDFSPIYKFPKFDSNKIKDELKGKLDSFLSEYKIEIIDSKLANIETVFKQYFEVSPPFKDGNKKHEFPDAFIINSIEEWCKSNSKNSFFISIDNDGKDIKSKNIDTEHNLNEILEILSKEIHKEHSEYIENEINDYLESVENIISKNYLEELTDSVSSDLQYQWQFENSKIVSEPTIKNVKIDSISLNYIEPNESFSYDADFEINFEIEISYTDLSCATYDKEDDVWFGYEETTITIEYNAECNAELVFIYFFDGQNDNVEFDCIEDFKIKKVTLQEEEKY